MSPFAFNLNHIQPAKDTFYKYNSIKMGKGKLGPSFLLD